MSPGLVIQLRQFKIILFFLLLFTRISFLKKNSLLGLGVEMGAQLPCNLSQKFGLEFLKSCMMVYWVRVVYGSSIHLYFIIGSTYEFTKIGTP